MRSTQVLATLATLALTTLAVPVARAQTPEDSAAIRATALDYIEGWYSGDAERMERALHPELVKRILVINPDTGRPFIDTMGAGRLVEGTRAAYGTQIPEAERRTDVTILDVFGNAAAVEIDAGGWIDYLQMSRVDGKWMIVNVLWERRQ
jgi:hypothetical protein